VYDELDTVQEKVEVIKSGMEDMWAHF